MARREETLDRFHADMVAQTWCYVGAMGALFAAFTAVVTLVVRL